MTVLTNPQKPAAGVWTASRIRWCVFTCALGMWGLYTLIGQTQGVPFPQSLVIGFLSGLGGLIVWWVYHLASGGNNGGIIVIFLNPHYDHYYKDADYRFAIAFKTLIFAIIFLGIGLACRKLQRSTARGDASAVDDTRETPKRSA